MLIMELSVVLSHRPYLGGPARSAALDRRPASHFYQVNLPPMVNRLSNKLLDFFTEQKTSKVIYSLNKIQLK
jgi:hypothetical protein